MSPKTPDNDAVLAACLTPPAPGGVAVIQVVGRSAPDLLTPLLSTGRPLDLTTMNQDELRLGRLVDGQEIIDDVLISKRRGPAGDLVDITLHGGPRVVQRALLLLKNAGVQIVEQTELLAQSWPTNNIVEQESLAALLRAKTRPVAAWLMQSAEQLPNELRQIIQHLKNQELLKAQTRLAQLGQLGRRCRYWLEGVRAVLVGEPNSGKSTLANALAEREGAVVSDVPGTTRDWVEHPAAVKGVPFAIVDTAGLRSSNDPVEGEAIQRTHQQIAQADALIRVIDVSTKPSSQDREFIIDHLEFPGREPVAQPPPGGPKPTILAWNKADLLRHCEHIPLITKVGAQGVLLSALTGEGILELRRKLCAVMGLADWRKQVPGPFTARQLEACEGALSALSRPQPDTTRALTWMQFALDGGIRPDDAA